jgi:hypothetical protein
MELEELKIVSNAVKNASGFGLEVEVVTFALKYMKENPSLSIVEAIIMSYEDWVK